MAPGPSPQQSIDAQRVVITMVFAELERHGVAFDEAPADALASVARWCAGADEAQELEHHAAGLRAAYEALEHAPDAAPALIVALSALRCLFDRVREQRWANGEPHPVPTVALWWCAAALECLGEGHEDAEARVTLTWHRALGS